MTLTLKQIQDLPTDPVRLRRMFFAPPERRPGQPLLVYEDKDMVDPANPLLPVQILMQSAPSRPRWWQGCCGR